jgi:hypothetical protein
MPPPYTYLYLLYNTQTQVGTLAYCNLKGLHGSTDENKLRKLRVILNTICTASTWHVFHKAAPLTGKLWINEIINYMRDGSPQSIVTAMIYPSFILYTNGDIQLYTINIPLTYDTLAQKGIDFTYEDKGTQPNSRETKENVEISVHNGDCTFTLTSLPGQGTVLKMHRSKEPNLISDSHTEQAQEQVEDDIKNEQNVKDIQQHITVPEQDSVLLKYT